MVLDLDDQALRAAIDPELEDLVISGGDVYNLGARGIGTIGRRLLEIPHVRRIRYATKGFLGYSILPPA